MPFPTLLRRGRRSDVDIRRHSSVVEPVHLTGSSDLLGSTESVLDRPSDDPEGVDPAPTNDRTENGLLAPPGGSKRVYGFPGLARFRNASDSQLSTRVKEDAAGGERAVEPSTVMPPPPSIITTAPTLEPLDKTQARMSRPKLPGYFRSSKERLTGKERGGKSELVGGGGAGGGELAAKTTPARQSRVLKVDGTLVHPGVPPAYGDESSSSLALPVTRLSESSRSDASSGDRIAYSTTTTTQTVSTTTTIFRLPRRKKRASPLSPRPATPGASPRESPRDEPSTSTRTTSHLDPHASRNFPSRRDPPRPHTAQSEQLGSGRASTSDPDGVPANVGLRRKTQVFRQESTNSARSTKSTPALVPPSRPEARDRSSTLTSLNEEMMRSTPSLPSLRASTATTSRSSFGGLFGRSRLRPSLDSAFPRGSPGSPSGNNSKPNSLSLARESVVIPDREPEETPARYLARLHEVVHRSAIAGALARSDDAFSQAVLRSYMRSFAFFEDPMDMAIRKLLMKIELPKETQQIDRVLQRFADRYHECNPGIFASAEEAYFVAFSLLILQTDAFNKNNKHKMQKPDYIKNTHEYGEGISEDVLACFYDNICYTPFIHVEDDLEISGGRIPSRKGRKSKFPLSSAEIQKKALKEPIDPYTLILEGRLDFLRPNLKDVMNSDDPYGYLGTAKYLDLPDLQRTFFRWGVLQIVSARSRPDAFTSPTTITNPEDAHPGVVDIKVTKIGLLWRKDVKKKKTRSPWQEWGAILTGSQLYFFKNVAWIKGLLHQYEQHQKSSRPGSPVTFKPPLENFKPDALMSTDDAVALLDSSYKKHKNAFIFVRHGGFEETLLAESESEMNDWLAKLNYAAAFRTAGVRMRAMVRRADKGAETRRTDTNHSNVSSVKGGPPPPPDEDVDGPLTQQILLARRQIIRQKIQEANDKLLVAQKQLEHQLRNSRHLQTLAPIQAKNREQVILAAGRMAAKLKWIRMEIWRVKCHRDILWLDLKDEGVLQEGLDGPENIGECPVAGSSMDVELTQLGGDADHPLRSWGSHPSSHPSVGPSSKDLGSEMDDRKSNGDHAERFESIASRAAWEPVYDAAASRRSSIRGESREGQEVSAQLGVNDNHHNQRVASRASSSVVQQHSPTGSAKLAPRKLSAEEAETELLKRAGFIRVNSSSAEGRVGEQDASEQASQTLSDNEGNDKSTKVRRSLHRSLRDNHLSGHHHHHHRHKKGRDSSSSAAAITEDAGTLTSGQERLARGTGSFTLHGKKASVVTFGSEWQSLAAEDQLRQRKHAQGGVDDGGLDRSGSRGPFLAPQLVTTTTATTMTTARAPSGLGLSGESSMHNLLQSNASDSTVSSSRVGGEGHREETMPGSWEEEAEEDGDGEGGGGGRVKKDQSQGKQRLMMEKKTSRYGGGGDGPVSEEDDEDEKEEEEGKEDGKKEIEEDGEKEEEEEEKEKEERQQETIESNDTSQIEWNTIRYSTAVTTDEEYQSAPEES